MNFRKNGWLCKNLLFRTLTFLWLEMPLINTQENKFVQNKGFLLSLVFCFFNLIQAGHEDVIACREASHEDVASLLYQTSFSGNVIKFTWCQDSSFPDSSLIDCSSLDGSSLRQVHSHCFMGNTYEKGSAKNCPGMNCSSDVGNHCVRKYFQVVFNDELTA